MLDRERKAEVYFVYLKKLIQEEFSGSVTVEFFKGGIRCVSEDDEPVIRLKRKRTVKLR